jgi:hypothetical protein
MKKYKLIKQYPASPKLGFIVAQKPCGIYYNMETGIHYGSATLENYPEYWQEVVDHEFEIISFKQDSGVTDLWTKFREGWSRNVNGYPVTGPYSTEAILENSLYKIHSVKRLSDGEIFTVGDRAKTITSKGKHTVTQLNIKQKCKGRDGKGGYNYDGIDRIWIDWEDDCGGNWLESIEKLIEKDYEILSQVTKYNPLDDYKASGTKIHSVKRLSDGEVFTVGDLIKTPYTDCTQITGFKNPEGDEYFIEIPTGLTRLLSLEKVKQPIFLTHDGKDIFAGDKVWWVRKDSSYYDSLISVPGMKFHSNLNAYFLTEAAALDYIRKNKVLFTTEDGVGIKKGNMVHGVFRTSNTISNTVVGCNRGLHDTFEVIFSTRAAAENYLVQKSYSLSIEDFWEFVSWGGSTIAKSKRLKRLVKDRLGIK